MKITPDTSIIITGGASGFGLETLRRFYAMGCKLTAADLNEKAFPEL